MSRKSPEFHIVIPGLFEAVSATSRQLRAGSFPALEKFLSRSQVSDFAGDYPHVLAHLLGLPFDRQHDVPTAALSAFGTVAETELMEYSWIQAFPVLLQPDRDRLVLHPAPANLYQRTNLPRLETLRRRIIEHFSPFFSDILLTEENGWLFKLPKDAKISTSPLIDTVGRNIDNLMPVGEEQSRWHSLMNEMQMLFYSQNCDALGFNSLWFEGVGRLPQKNHIKSAVAGLGTEPLLEAMTSWHGVITFDSLDDFVPQAGDFVSLVSADLSIMRSIQGRSEERWLQTMKELDGLFLRLRNLLVSGVISSISLYPMNETVHKIEGRAGSFKFWKKSLPLGHW